MGQVIYNYLRGFVSALEIWPQSRRNPIGGGLNHQTDSQALQSDWEVIGLDLSEAMESKAEEFAGHGQR